MIIPVVGGVVVTTVLGSMDIVKKLVDLSRLFLEDIILQLADLVIIDALTCLQGVMETRGPFVFLPFVVHGMHELFVVFLFKVFKH